MAFGARASHCAFYPMSAADRRGPRGRARGLRHEPGHHPLPADGPCRPLSCGSWSRLGSRRLPARLAAATGASARLHARARWPDAPGTRAGRVRIGPQAPANERPDPRLRWAGTCCSSRASSRSPRTFQTLYFLADLYFVGTLGKEAVAGRVAVRQPRVHGARADAVARRRRHLADRPGARAQAARAGRARVQPGAGARQPHRPRPSVSWPSPRARPTAAGWPPTRRPPRAASSTCPGSCRRSRCSSRSWRWGRRCAGWAT